jgi:hypothetical protein
LFAPDDESVASADTDADESDGLGDHTGTSEPNKPDRGERSHNNGSAEANSTKLPEIPDDRTRQAPSRESAERDDTGSAPRSNGNDASPHKHPAHSDDPARRVREPLRVIGQLAPFDNGVGITALEVTPDGKGIVTGDRSGEVKLWDAGSGSISKIVDLILL